MTRKAFSLTLVMLSLVYFHFINIVKCISEFEQLFLFSNFVVLW